MYMFEILKLLFQCLIEGVWGLIFFLLFARSLHLPGWGI